MPMVQYWITSDASPAAITTNKDGATIMKIGDGDKREKYDFSGFPRSHMLFGPVSKIKHEVKNQIFNYAWYALEEGKPKEEIIETIKGLIRNRIKVTDTKTIAGREYKVGEDCMEVVKYDQIPPEKMFSGVREIYRALTVLEAKSPSVKYLKELLTLVLSEDDAYRMRLEWLVQIFNPSAWWFRIFFHNPIKDFDLALAELEVAEVTRDMKEKAVLLRRVLMLILEDKRIKELFLEFCKEMDWKKLKMTEALKYHARAKYFKVDLDRFEY